MLSAAGEPIFSSARPRRSRDAAGRRARGADRRPRQRRPLSRADRGAARGRADVPEDAGRQPDQRRGRRGAARTAERRDHEGGRRPVRAVRPRGAGGLRRRLDPRRHRSRPPDADRLLRDLPAGPLSAALLQGAEGARPQPAARRLRPRRGGIGAAVLDERHRAVAGAEPQLDHRRPRRAGRRHHRPRPRLPADVLALARRGRTARRARRLRYATVAVGNLRGGLCRRRRPRAGRGGGGAAGRSARTWRSSSWARRACWRARPPSTASCLR